MPILGLISDKDKKYLLFITKLIMQCRISFKCLHYLHVLSLFYNTLCLDYQPTKKKKPIVPPGVTLQYYYGWVFTNPKDNNNNINNSNNNNSNNDSLTLMNFVYSLLNCPRTFYNSTHSITMPVKGWVEKKNASKFKNMLFIYMEKNGKSRI